MIETNEQALERWNREIGHTTGFDYLNENSHVWEIGLWHGHWVEQIAKNYNPYIVAFEPIWEWYMEGVCRFANNQKVAINHFGLGDRNVTRIFCIKADATGQHSLSESVQFVHIFPVVDIIKAEHIENIDLMQCNCEGGEYEIFSALIESGLITRFDNLLIQFHNLLPNHADRRADIQKGLSKTHTQGLCVDWVFEYWKRK